MQKDPLWTVKKAADKLGLDERAVLERLIAGQLKGEKRSNWLRDEWLVSSGAVQSELAKNKPGPKPDTKLAERAVEVEAEPLPDDGSEDPDGKRGDWLHAERTRLEQIVEHVMKPLVEKVAAQAEALAEKDKIIQEQDLKLRLLPDLQKKSAETDETIKQKTIEVSELREQLGQLKTLKVQLDEIEKSKQELESFMGQELERVAREKELGESAAREQVSALTAELEHLRKPWWKRLLPPS